MSQQKTPDLYPVNIDITRPNVSFGLPDYIRQASAYSDYELMRFLDYGLVKKLQDAETAQDYLLFRRNIDGDGVFKLLENAQNTLVSTISAVRAVLDSAVDLPLQKGNFWRYLIDFPDSASFEVDDAEGRVFSTPDRHGPHAAIEHRDEHTIVRVKASTLKELKDLYDEIQINLI